MRTYLLASFPALAFEGPCPMEFNSFLQNCSSHLPPSEFSELDAVCSTPPEGDSSFSRKWRTTLADWRSFNTQERKQKLGQEKGREIYIDSDQLRGDLYSAWQTNDPLLREKALAGSLWNWIETQRRSAPFSLDDLIGYALQLRILERMALWNESEGQTQFQEHTQSFLEPVLEELRKQDLSA